jgi:hypothetical protein
LLKRLQILEQNRYVQDWQCSISTPKCRSKWIPSSD